MPQYFGQLHTTEPAWSILEGVQAIQQGDLLKAAALRYRHILFKCGDPYLKLSVLAAL